MRVIARNDVVNMTLYPGDRIVLSHRENGRTTEVLRSEARERMDVDVAMIVEFEGELGLRRGIGGIFGQKEAPK